MEPIAPQGGAFDADALHDHFLHLYAVALSDLRLDPTELAKLYDIGERRGVPTELIDSVILNPNKAQPALPDDVLDRVECLYDFALMIQADGLVDEAEERMLVRLCAVFGFVEENAREIAAFLLERAASGAGVADVRAEAEAAM